MTNTQMFDKKMREAGFTYNSLARRMGVTNTTIRAKAQNFGQSGPFTVSEMYYIKTLFGLTEEESRKMFGR